MELKPIFPFGDKFNKKYYFKQIFVNLIAVSFIVYRFNRFNRILWCSIMDRRSVVWAAQKSGPRKCGVRFVHFGLLKP